MPFDKDEKVTYVLQSMKCNNYGKMHILLPDKLTPCIKHKSKATLACIDAQRRS
jgi:hypothetical protein